MHEQMQKMMSANEKEGMGMCRMMMGMDKGGDHDGETPTITDRDFNLGKNRRNGFSRMKPI